MLVPAVASIRRDRHVFDPQTNEILYLNQDLATQAGPTDLIETLEEPVAHLPGRFVFGGVLRLHFGHFLVECLGPLWALDHAPGDVDGILYLHYHPTPALDAEGRTPEADPRVAAHVIRHAEHRLKALGIDLPVHFITTPTQVDHLTIGENAFGFGEKFRGSSFFQKFIRTRNVPAPTVQATNPRQKIYISRTQLKLQKGRLIGEEALERTFSEAGYTIYAPEQHSFEHQLETYRTAEAIVAVEGSALHLPPFSCPSDCRVAIVARRSNAEGLAINFGLQFEGIAGVRPVLISAVSCFWGPPNQNGQSMESHSVVDFDEIYDSLVANGFLKPSDRTYQPSSEDLCDHLKKTSTALGYHMHISGLDREIEATKKRAAEAAKERERLRNLSYGERWKIRRDAQLAKRAEEAKKAAESAKQQKNEC